MNGIALEMMSPEHLPFLRLIDRGDVPEEFVDDADAIWDIHCYGVEHKCIGCTFSIRLGRRYIGYLLLGEALSWETDPPQMRKEPFYRLMGFMLDKAYRSSGIGSQVLEMAIAEVYRRFGVRPIALGCHRENTRAAAFYQRHGFTRTDAMEGQDIYYLRYPKKE